VLPTPSTKLKAPEVHLREGDFSAAREYGKVKNRSPACSQDALKGCKEWEGLADRFE
jgi:hypothetical protein